MDEYDIIRAIAGKAGKPPSGYSRIGDDVAAIPTRRGRLIMKCDMLVAKTDVPPGMTWRMAARKSVAMCVSDFSAKGVKPDSFMASLGIPRGAGREDVEGLADGFRDAATEWDVRLVGGDTNEADELVIDCTMVGFSDRFVRRDTAREGELLIVTGDFGYPSAGLKILLRGARASAAFRRRAVRSVYYPTPRLRAGLNAGRHLSSSIDSSDGLAVSLHTLAEMSGVGFEVEEVPLPKQLRAFASANGYEAEELALYGGEEYEVVGTVRPGRYGEAKAAARAAGCELKVIGRTTKERGVALSDGAKIEKRGWVHLA